MKRPSCGAITFVQRFGSALQLNVHFPVPDGAFDDDGVFVADEAPDNDDVRCLMVRAGRRVMSKLYRFFDDDERRREIDGRLGDVIRVRVNNGVPGNPELLLPSVVRRESGRLYQVDREGNIRRTSLTTTLESESAAKKKRRRKRTR